MNVEKVSELGGEFRNLIAEFTEKHAVEGDTVQQHNKRMDVMTKVALTEAFLACAGLRFSASDSTGENAKTAIEETLSLMARAFTYSIEPMAEGLLLARLADDPEAKAEVSNLVEDAIRKARDETK